MLAASTFIRTSSFFNDGTGISTYWSNNRLFCSIYLFSSKRMGVDSTWTNSIYKDPKCCDMGPEITNRSSMNFHNRSGCSNMIYIIYCSLSRKHIVATFHIIRKEATIYEHNPEVNSFAFTPLPRAVSFLEARWSAFAKKRDRCENYWLLPVIKQLHSDTEQRCEMSNHSEISMKYTITAYAVQSMENSTD
jgi:hypothetical protein